MALSLDYRSFLARLMQQAEEERRRSGLGGLAAGGTPYVPHPLTSRVPLRDRLAYHVTLHLEANG